MLGKPERELQESDRQELGVVLSDAGFSEYLQVKDVIDVMKSMYPNFEKDCFISRCEQFQIPLDKKIKEFSTGMKAKLKVLLALSHDAKFLIMDEPTAGLDVAAREDVLDLLREYMEEKEERAILISSHISSDLEGLCDDLYMIHNGKIVLHEETDVLLGEYAVLKVDEEQYQTLDKQYILSRKKEAFGYQLLTRMKGMLVKDFCILKLQKNAVLVLLAMCVVFTVFMKSPTYIVNLFPLYGFLLVLGTLTYDEFDRGYSFLFTLPVSRRGYVKEKYVFGLLFCGGIWILSVLISLIYVWITKEIPIDDALMVNYAVSIILVLVFMGISIPVQLKYGNEKGRLAVVAIGVGGFVVIVGGIVSVILIVISYKISVRIMEKKEF